MNVVERIDKLKIYDDLDCYYYYVKEAIKNNEPLDENVVLQLKYYANEFALIAKEVEQYIKEYKNKNTIKS